MEASKLIDKQIAGAASWRGDLLAKLRQIIHQADPEIVEEWKWGTAVFTHGGNVCAIAAFKDHVKINFFKGSQLSDPHKLINAGLESKNNKAIDFKENDRINEPALIELIKEAVALNK